MTRVVACLAFVLATLLGRIAAADDANLGGPGESCRARADCRRGLKCIAATCVDEHEGTSCQATSDCGELRCVRNTCVSPQAVLAVHREPPAPGYWRGFQLHGAHPFLGLTALWGATTLGASNVRQLSDARTSPSVLFAFRGGLMLGRNEIAAEISPMTYVSSPGAGVLTMFQFNVSYGHYLPLHEGAAVSVYWPLRIGIGAIVADAGGLAFFQARADVLGITLRAGHLMFDLAGLSCRYGVTRLEFSNNSAWGTTALHHVSVQAGTSVSYVF